MFFFSFSSFWLSVERACNLGLDKLPPEGKGLHICGERRQWLHWYWSHVAAVAVTKAGKCHFCLRPRRSVPLSRALPSAQKEGRRERERERASSMGDDREMKPEATGVLTQRERAPSSRYTSQRSQRFHLSGKSCLSGLILADCFVYTHTHTHIYTHTHRHSCCSLDNNFVKGYYFSSIQMPSTPPYTNTQHGGGRGSSEEQSGAERSKWKTERSRQRGSNDRYISLKVMNQSLQYFVYTSLCVCLSVCVCVWV